MGEQTEFEPIQLSPLDQAIPPVYIRILLCFSVVNVDRAISQLQTGVSSLLSALPFLSGDVVRYTAPGKTKWLYQLCPPTHQVQATGVLVVKHHQMRCMVDEKRFAPSSTSHIPLSPFAEPARPAPIFRVQANAYIDGITLGFAFHHIAVDATGMGVIISELARHCRSSPPPSLLCPDYERATRQLISNSRATECSGLDHSGDYISCQALSPPAEGSEDASPSIEISTETRTFVFPAARLESLKNACIEMLPTLDQQQRQQNPCLDEPARTKVPWLSTNDVFVALLWVCLTRCRYQEDQNSGLPSDEHTRICMGVNMRSRIQPPLSADYLGNAILSLSFKLNVNVFRRTQVTNESIEGVDSKDIEHKQWLATICRVARNIRRGVNGMDDSYFRSVVSFLEDSSDCRLFDYARCDFCVPSWRHLGVYHADFGEMGRPKSLEVFDVPGDGSFCILPQRYGAAAPWEVCFSVNSQVLGRLRRDPILSRYMSHEN
ncbi:unnamed protein product [Aspergillus oryzae var. brunneus]|uniref:Unnamed protein product n=1 Tax=Aspergillus oryzae var. brunneus TaxID=332754 RepID=A0ABQ6KKK1_ASPOZ|nr:unnamed protein product [Aspergillus oryzae var. brunneus]